MTYNVSSGTLSLYTTTTTTTTARGTGYALECRFSKFVEITQSKSHYAVQGHSRSPILVPIESSYATYY